MKLLSVNVSPVRVIELRGGPVSTGIFKEAVEGRVAVRKLGLEGDAQADLSVHGGVDKAAYAYAWEHYSYWRDELGRDDFQYGQFGENLTIEGALESDLHIGDIFQLGSARLQITTPREPCGKFAFKMGSVEFPKRFLQSGRLGFYLRVIEEGEVGAGDAFELVEADPREVTLAEYIKAYFFDRDDLGTARRILDIESLNLKARAEFEKRLRG